MLLCDVLTLVGAGAGLVYEHALGSAILAFAIHLSRTKDARLGRLKSLCLLRSA
jgi:hypothetical protein